MVGIDTLAKPITGVVRGLSWQRVAMAEGCHGKGLPLQVVMEKGCHCKGLPWQRVAMAEGYHPSSGDVADIVCHDAPAEYKKTLQFLLSTRVGPAEDNPPPYR